MEQEINETLPLTAKIKSGHMTMMLSFNMEHDENNNLIKISFDDNKTEYELSEAMQLFVNSCFGKCIINPNSFTITFTDSRDFMQYQLTEGDENLN